MTHLDKLRIWNKTIRVMASKHQAVQMPEEGQPDAGLTRDYTGACTGSRSRAANYSEHLSA
ncbi:hypothetical protein pipiens_019807, partial [Culex pipiens pipiens]